MELHGERFVVTGSSGFIGGHIVDAISEQGKAADRYDLPHGDITEEPLFFNGATAVFHEACSKCTVCRDNPFRDLTTNAWGSFRVFDAAAKAGAKVVHASTGSVYGDGHMQHEQMQYGPKSFYGVSKLAGEQYLRAFKEYYGLRFVALRYFHVYGPRQNSGPDGGVVAIFIDRMLNGLPITIYGDGNQTRSFTYVKDVVAANFHAANSKAMEGQYFNVASGISITLNRLVDILAEMIGCSPDVQHVPAKPGDIKHFNVSNDKLEQYGFNQWTGFEQGLEETIAWYRRNYEENKMARRS